MKNLSEEQLTKKMGGGKNNERQVVKNKTKAISTMK